MKRLKISLTLSFIIFTLSAFSSTLFNAQDTPSPDLLVGEKSGGLLFTPDGSRAFIAVSTSNKMAILDMKTLTVTGEIHDLNNPDGMAWAVAP